MKLSFGPRGILQIDDAQIIFRNFSGRPDRYNREGDRNFALRINDQETADALINEGWNVRIKPPREDGDTPFMYLPVKVQFNDRGPAVYLQSGKARNTLTEDTVSVLDNIDILSVDMDIRPYDWQLADGKSGRKAYLQSMLVHQKVDRFAQRDEEPDYMDEEDPF
jgi:hypothetical protein